MHSSERDGGHGLVPWCVTISGYPRASTAPERPLACPVEFHDPARIVKLPGASPGPLCRLGSVFCSQDRDIPLDEPVASILTGAGALCCIAFAVSTNFRPPQGPSIRSHNHVNQLNRHPKLDPLTLAPVVDPPGLHTLQTPQFARLDDTHGELLDRLR